MTKVKICGITNLEDALHAADHGADMLGFNFYRGSKRYVDPSIVNDMVRSLADVQKVGVFVNADVQDLMKVANQGKLDAIQVHGNETPEFVAQIRGLLPNAVIFKAVRVGPGFESKDVARFGADFILLDGDAGDFGGAGRTFAWSKARGIDNLILAGGLTPENVADAVRTVRPYAVDVASGVESSPGKKDPKKVEAFITNAKAA
jgi:phosphoribosylanthranilate isomerase